ncbi:MAG: hypothetical protein DI547_07120 [Sphingobium sp.]|nr:MAG: hypothetical protein DI547_07120 [Sphingobium sp.]
MVFRFSAVPAAVLIAGIFAGPALAAPVEELGYNRGSLGVSAILSADFGTAEAQLNNHGNGVKASDPLRLINLGNVYAGTGRLFDAQNLYMSVLRQPAVEVTTADGAITDTHEVAQMALRRVQVVAAAR